MYEILSLIAVAALWGCTNPLIKKGTTGINKVKSDSRIAQFLLELKYLFTNFQYIIPMGLNQSGSVLYFLTLQHADLSLAVPVANSLTFVFTALMGWFLNEGLPTKRTTLGVILVLSGTGLLYYDKQLQEKP